MRERKEYKPSLSQFKILETVMLLNKEHYYPLPEGILKILEGSLDNEVENFRNYPTYQTLISYSSKKIHRSVMMLIRYGFLANILNREDNELYIRITNKGKETLEEFLKKRKEPYPKKKVTNKATIAKIE